ncbi:TetR family transcriptional regulator [Rhodovulum sp. DZ06]|uniref:TetR family transcriptional regulator n=1 Tax=Rhodovulum sp. DZ06 TaxID=3425126 RepID=UPI003D34C216
MQTGTDKDAPASAEAPDEAPDRAGGWRGSREGWLDAARAALVDSGVEAVKIAPLSAALGLSRTSFYWFFKDRAALLAALLDDWDAANTGAIRDACAAYAETAPEAVLNVIGAFLPGGAFESRLDFAIRGWAHRDAAVAARIEAADAARLSAIRAMFEARGFAPGEADVRARTMYLTQIGYISMQAAEDLPTRLARIPAYVKTFSGAAPTASELARFEARLQGR